MRIVITGTPGTGKTKIAPMLAKALGLELVDLKELVERRRLYSRKGGEREVDIKRLRGVLLPELQKAAGKRGGYVVEGHLACEFGIPADFVVVLRTHPDALGRRLAPRGYKKQKLEGNLLSEMLDYCTQRAGAEYGGKKVPILELDTSRAGPRACVKKLLRAIKGRKKTLDRVDYSGELRKHLGLR